VATDAGNLPMPKDVLVRDIETWRGYIRIAKIEPE
jgi:hypothetical protein